MLVQQILPAARERLIVLGADAPLMAAAKLLRDSHLGLVVVCGAAGEMVGVVTKSDIVRQISVCQGSTCMAAAATVMTTDVAYCRPGDFLQDVWPLMMRRNLVNIPVVDQGSRPVGVLRALDVLQALLTETKDEEALLRDYVMGVGYQ